MRITARKLPQAEVCDGCQTNEQRLFISDQWNPIDLVTNRPQKSGCINGVAIYEGFFE